MAKKAFYSLLSLGLGLASLSCGSQTGLTQAKITKDKKLYVGTVPFEPPLLFQDSQMMVGPEARLVEELTRKFEQEMGVELEPFWITRSYKTLAAALSNDEIDFVVGVYGISDSRKEEIDFSEPYYTSELVLIINPSHKADLRPNDLEGQRIGVREGTVIGDKVVAKYPSSEVIPSDTLDEAILALKRGELDCVIDDRLLAAYALATAPGASHLEIVPGVIDSVNCAVAVRKGDTVLPTVNQVVKQIKSEGKYMAWAQEYLNDYLEQVEGRHQARLERAQKASEPRRVTIRVSKDQNNSFDIYRFANLSFVLTENSTGESFTASRIDFQGRTGVSAVNVPPGSYRVYLPKFNFSPGTVTILASDPESISVNILLRADGNVTLTRS